MKNSSVNKEINNCLMELLQRNFGEAAGAFDITMEGPFILIEIQDFLMPSEKALLKRKEEMRILKTRELIMNKIKPELLAQLEKLLEVKIKDIYADWNLSRKTGCILAVMSDETGASMGKWPEAAQKDAIEEEIVRASEKTQKKPEFTKAYWINKKLIVVERRGIMVEIEQELLKLGVKEELKIAKRLMEHRMVDSAEFQLVLDQELTDWFVDWNFDEDKAYMVLVC